MEEIKLSSAWQLHKETHKVEASSNCFYCYINTKNDDKNELIKTINQKVEEDQN